MDKIMECRFSDKDLKKLIIPLIIEQFLQITVGLVDSFMVASLGEAAVSGVSLVDSIFVLLINVFTALATGGAVVAGQFIGRKDPNTGCRAAWQLILFVGTMSIVITAACYLGQNFILYRIFGDIEADVFHNSRIFLLIVSASIPFIALYNAGASIFRVMGNSKIGMIISLLMNGINLVGVAVMIFGFHCGVEGAAIPTLLARIVAAVVILKLLCNQNRLLHIPRPITFKIDRFLLRNTLRIAVPNGLESSMFQLGKILVLSLISGFNSICVMAIWPLSFTLPNTLRASNDVAYTMIAAIFSMWVFRVGFSYLLGVYLDIGVFGVWVAMTIDWMFRAICFSIRYKRNKWMT